MIDFGKAWTALPIGAEVQVTNGAIEPLDPESVEHRAWRSHNFTGILGEKIDGPPRQMRVEFENAAGNVIGFMIQEGDGHSFVPTVISPQLARDLQWEAAKAYRAQRQCLPVAIPDVVEGAVVVADADPESAAIIDRLARGALTALMMQVNDFSLTFTDHNNVEFTVNAEQTVKIGNAVLLSHSLCHGASQAVRKALDDALAAGATAEDILAIDVTAGYPA